MPQLSQAPRGIRYTQSLHRHGRRIVDKAMRERGVSRAEAVREIIGEWEAIQGFRRAKDWQRDARGALNAIRLMALAAITKPQQRQQYLRKMDAAIVDLASHLSAVSTCHECP